MGQEITYCSKCQSQLRSSDFEKGKAIRVDGVNYCSDCAPSQPSPAAPVGTTSERGLNVTPAGGYRRAGAPKPGANPALFVGIGIAVVVILAALVLSGGGEKPAAPRDPRPAAGPLIVDIPTPRPEPPVPVVPKPAPPVVAPPPKPVEAAPVVAPPAPAPAAKVEPPPEPPRPVAVPEAEIVRKNWRAAMDLASGRDYAAAIKELERARQETASAVQKSELTADLEVLRALAAAVDDVAKSLQKIAKGQKVALSFVNDSGSAQRVEGVLVRSEPTRMVVKSGEETAVVPLTDLTAACLAEMIQARGGARPAWLLCCLEGDLDGIKKPPSDALPAKYEALATAIAQRTADPEASKRELEARRQGAAADAEASAPATCGSGIEKLGVLLKEFADTRYVRRNLPLIRARMEAGKEFVFSADLSQGAGTFMASKSAKAGGCWTSNSDSPSATRKDNFVELEFWPLPSVDYRCWVYVGACCGETFEFFYQASELAGFEPGSAAGTPAKNALWSVRKHSGHNGPKQPSRWGWVALPLPKFAAPGAKKVRILTDQQGFSVGVAVVSSTRTAAPTDAELKEWERVRAADPPKVPNDPSLVAYYSFDQGSGTAAVDLTRNANHGELKNGAKWAAGKFGKAVEFDGVGACIKIPTSASFDSCSKQITITAWVYRKSVLPDFRTLVGRQKGVSQDDQWALALVNDGGAFSLGGDRQCRTVALPGNQWIHLAVAFDGTMMSFYLDGNPISGHKLQAPTPLIVEPKPVTIGAGMNNSGDQIDEAFHGLIDEVRIYNRALSAAEITALAKANKP